MCENCSTRAHYCSVDSKNIFPPGRYIILMTLSPRLCCPFFRHLVDTVLLLPPLVMQSINQKRGDLMMKHAKANGERVLVKIAHFHEIPGSSFEIETAKNTSRIGTKRWKQVRHAELHHISKDDFSFLLGLSTSKSQNKPLSSVIIVVAKTR